MKNTVYAMDTHFMCGNEGPTAAEQVELVKAAGFGAYYFTGWREKPEKFLEVRDATLAAGLEFAASLTPFDVEKAPTDSDVEDVDSLLGKFPKETLVEITLLCGGFGNHVGDTSMDEKALPWLKLVEPLLEKHGLRAVLYPHFGFYMETFSDALRLLGGLESERFGVIFTGYHWNRVAKEESFAELLKKAGERLFSVNLCGSRHWDNEDDVVNGLNPSIEPMDAGTLDNVAIVEELKRIGFAGPIGIQGYGVNDTAESALNRSAKWFQEH